MRYARYLVFGFFFFSITLAQATTDPQVTQLAAKPLPEVKQPSIAIRTLSNGMKIYYLQDTELPVFKMSAFFEVGNVWETQQQRGINSLFFSALKSGGTTSLTPDQIEERLDFLAASLDGSGDAELSRLRVECLLKDANEITDIFFDLIMKPAFDEKRLEIIRQGALDAIKKRNENPASIAAREFKQSLYGKGSPHAWLPTPETINAITRQALLDYHEKNMAPGKTWIAASSPLSVDEFVSRIETRVKSWDKILPKQSYPTNIKKEWESSADFVHKEGNQTSIVLGHFAEKRFNPDKYALILINQILGGSTFGARLGNRIRTELGLAYGIASYFDFATDYGAFSVLVQTKSESTASTLREIRKILSDMVRLQNITQKELDFARDKTLSSLVFEFERPFHIVETRLKYDYHGYPPDYFDIYQREIKKVTLEQVNSVLSKYFFPDKLKIMVVGDKNRIFDGLPEFTEIPLDNE